MCHSMCTLCIHALLYATLCVHVCAHEYYSLCVIVCMHIPVRFVSTVGLVTWGSSGVAGRRGGWCLFCAELTISASQGAGLPNSGVWAE